MSCVPGEAVLYTGTTEIYNDSRWFEVRAWHIFSSGEVELVKGWADSVYPIDDALGDWGTGCEPLYSYGQAFCDYCTVDETKGTGYSVRSSTSLYNSSGTAILLIPADSTVWVTEECGSAGYRYPYYFTISGYTVNGVYNSCTQTTFVNAGFNTGKPDTYKVYTTCNLTTT